MQISQIHLISKLSFFSRKQQEIKPIFGFIIGKEDKGIRGKDWGVKVTEGGKGKRREGGTGKKEKGEKEERRKRGIGEKN